MSIVASGQEFELYGEGVADFLNENKGILAMSSDGKIRSTVPLLKSGGSYYYKTTNGWQVVEGLSYDPQRVIPDADSSGATLMHGNFDACKVIKHTQNEKILNERQLKNFINAFKIEKLIFFQGQDIDFQNFEEKFNKDFQDVTITLKNEDGMEDAYDVCDADDRGEIVKNANKIICAHGASKLDFKKPGLFKKTPKGSKILRYVAYMEMLDIFTKLKNFKYKDLQNGKGDELVKKVENLIALMEIKKQTKLTKYRKRDRFVKALKMWIKAYNKAKNMEIQNGFYIEKSNEQIYSNNQTILKYPEPFTHIEYHSPYETNGSKSVVNSESTNNTNNIIHVAYQSPY